MPPPQSIQEVRTMNETQKDFIKFWTKLVLIATASISLLVGMFMGSKICMIFCGLICLGMIAYVFIIWIAERIYLWRIMGVLTQSEWKIAKWYKYSLLNGGPNYIIKLLAEEETPCPVTISIFEKIANNVKIPKLLLDNSSKS